MKKIVERSVIAAFVLGGVFSVSPVYAAGLCPSGGQYDSLCNIKLENSAGTVGSVVEFLIIIAIVLCLFFLLFGGIRYTTSGGDKGKIDQARATLTSAIIGLVVSLVAFALVSTILYFFTGQGFTNLSLPTLLQ